ncbi:MAG: hypothetical protein IPM66_08585 [Acidobacteriota bacterium]|nr:MAG: hypothetical protein IPM66_08585 [Acidobacteriota bacterium]
MSITFAEIKPETAERIATLAKAHGLSVDEYLNSLLPEEEEPQAQSHFYETAGPQEWINAFRDWIASHAERDYGLVDDSRENLYLQREERQL